MIKRIITTLDQVKPGEQFEYPEVFKALTKLATPKWFQDQIKTNQCIVADDGFYLRVAYLYDEVIVEREVFTGEDVVPGEFFRLEESNGDFAALRKGNIFMRISDYFYSIPISGSLSRSSSMGQALRQLRITRLTPNFTEQD